MRFLRILPAVWPRTSWPFSRRTRNIALGSSSTTVPRISSNSSLAKRFLSSTSKSRGALAVHRGNVKAGSDSEHGGSARLSAFQCTVRFGGVGERKALANLNLHLCAFHHVEQGTGRLLEIGGVERVVVERWTGEK